MSQGSSQKKVAGGNERKKFKVGGRGGRHADLENNNLLLVEIDRSSGPSTGKERQTEKSKGRVGGRMMILTGSSGS